MSGAADKYINLLPDAFVKTPDSNNYKILSLNADLIADLKKDIEDVNTSLDIFQATGKTLDLYGQIYGQLRGQLDDTKYRYMILFRIATNTVNADYDSISKLAVQMFECEPTDFVLEDVDKPATVKLTKLPYSVLLKTGFTSVQAVAMVELLLPVSITLEAYNFEGTFAFSSSDEIEVDENAGFADIDQTIGGYLGLIYGEDVEIPLPI